MKILMVLCVLFITGNAHADGNKLLEYCQVTLNQIDTRIPPSDFVTALNSGRCLGFVKGVRSTMQILLSDEYHTRHRVCFPTNSNDGQIIRVVVKYLKDNPERLHENETLLAMTAIQSAFRCNE